MSAGPASPFYCIMNLSVVGSILLKIKRIFFFLFMSSLKTGFIRVREMSGKFKNFQGQGIVREFHNLSGKIEFLLKCQGNVREI